MLIQEVPQQVPQEVCHLPISRGTFLLVSPCCPSANLVIFQHAHEMQSCLRSQCDAHQAVRPACLSADVHLSS